MAGPLNSERRAGPRTHGREHIGTSQARLRPGRHAAIVNLSSGGALIETEWRLLPGSRVELQMGEFSSLQVVGRVLRCHVAALTRERVRYRGAVAFEKPLPIGEAVTHWRQQEP